MTRSVGISVKQFSLNTFLFWDGTDPCSFSDCRICGASRTIEAVSTDAYAYCPDRHLIFKLTVSLDTVPVTILDVHCQGKQLYACMITNRCDSKHLIWRHCCLMGAGMFYSDRIKCGRTAVSCLHACMYTQWMAGQQSCLNTEAHCRLPKWLCTVETDGSMPLHV